MLAQAINTIAIFVHIKQLKVCNKLYDLQFEWEIDDLHN